MVTNPIGGVYIPIIRIPIKRWDDHPQYCDFWPWHIYDYVYVILHRLYIYIYISWYYMIYLYTCWILMMFPQETPTRAPLDQRSARVTELDRFESIWIQFTLEFLSSTNHCHRWWKFEVPENSDVLRSWWFGARDLYSRIPDLFALKGFGHRTVTGCHKKRDEHFEWNSGRAGYAGFDGDIHFISFSADISV